MEGKQEVLGWCLKVFLKFVHDCCLKAPQNERSCGFSVFVCLFSVWSIFFNLISMHRGYFSCCYSNLVTSCFRLCVCVVLLQEWLSISCENLLTTVTWKQKARRVTVWPELPHSQEGKKEMLQLMTSSSLINERLWFLAAHTDGPFCRERQSSGIDFTTFTLTNSVLFYTFYFTRR